MGKNKTNLKSWMFIQPHIECRLAILTSSELHSCLYRCPLKLVRSIILSKESRNILTTNSIINNSEHQEGGTGTPFGNNSTSTTPSIHTTTPHHRAASERPSPDRARVAKTEPANVARHRSARHHQSDPGRDYRGKDNHRGEPGRPWDMGGWLVQRANRKGALNERELPRQKRGG